MFLKRQSIIRIINTLLFILLITVTVYISYNTTKHNEYFDGSSEEPKPQKITGTTTVLNGKNSIPNNNGPSTSKVKIVNASENNKSNEVNASYKASPSSIVVSSPTISPLVSAPSFNEPIPPTTSDLTPKEQQLFNAFLEKRITDDKIQELIESGILTEQLVEKFLAMIDDLPEGPPVNHAPKKLQSTSPSAQNDASLLEGFCGNNYARANGF